MLKILRIIKPIITILFHYGRVKIKLPQLWWGKGFLLSAKRDALITIGTRMHCRRGVQIRAQDGARIEIGDNVFFNSNVSVTALRSIKIGDRCKIANNVVIVDHDHDFLHENKGYIAKEIVIGEDVWIGANAVILKGVEIGDGAVVAAGAVVSKNVEAHTIVGGVPSRVIRIINND